MELMDLSLLMQDKIKSLEQGRTLIGKRGVDKANAISNYEKTLALTVLKIKNRKILEFEDEFIDEKLPANLVEKIAKGIVWKEKLEVEKCEALYKAGIIGMQSIMAELNALQSLNKYLDKV